MAASLSLWSCSSSLCFDFSPDRGSDPLVQGNALGGLQTQPEIMSKAAVPLTGTLP